MHSNDADFPALSGSGLLHDTGHTRHQPATANRNNDRRHLGGLIKYFQTDRSLSSDHIGVVKRRNSDGTGSLGKRRSLAQRLDDGVAAQDNLSPIGLSGLELGQCNTDGCEDGGFNALFASRKRYSLSVVAGTGCDHAVGTLFLGQFGHAVIRATDFVGTRSLQILTLEVDRLAQFLAEVARDFHRSGLSNSFQYPLGIGKVIQGGTRNSGRSFFSQKRHQRTLSSIPTTAPGSPRHSPAAKYVTTTLTKATTGTAKRTPGMPAKYPPAATARTTARG